MKTKYFFLTALAAAVFASCTDDEYIGDVSQLTQVNGTEAIEFSSTLPNRTRAGEFVGATAAEKLGGMFVVEGTKGTEQTNSPSTTVVFDNYLVAYTANTAGTTETNTNNWEYVGKQSGITGKLSGTTWTSLHSGATDAKSQTIKYWDYSQDQYDFIAWSTGEREAVAVAPTKNSTVQVTRINTGSTLATNGFTLTALSAADLQQCYYTDITTVAKANYNKPVTLTFKNMAAKVRVALYETVPGYSVSDVKFYSADANPTAPTDLGTGSSATNAVLFTMGGDVLPQSATILVSYPHIGTNHRGAVSGVDATYPHPAADYNKASVTVSAAAGGDAGVSTQTFGALTNQYIPAEAHEGATAISGGATLTASQATAVNAALGTSYAEDDVISAAHATAYNATISFYLGRTLPTATFAGSAAESFYQAVIPNTNGKPLTLRVDYTLVATDGSGETINIYGAKAVVPSNYTNWLPNYAYTYIFKISDNTNGWTSTTNSDPKGLFPITFDAMVASFTETNAEQTTVTTVATPSITTYQQGHDWANKDEYSKSQTAGASDAVKDVYVQVMDNSGATPTLKADLNGTKKSLLFSVETTGTTPISEATVMDAMKNRTNLYSDASPVGRNGITLTTNANIDNTVTSIVNGVDDQPITKIAGVAIAAGQVAKIDIDQLATGTYAYVYSTTVPTSDEKVYHVVSDAEATAHPTSYYEVKLVGTEEPLASGVAAADKVYFVKNVDENGDFVSYTFKQTKVGESVVGLVEASITSKATEHHATTAGNYYFYFDVYNQNDGEYAVKVIKVVG